MLLSAAMTPLLNSLLASAENVKPVLVDGVPRYVDVSFIPTLFLHY
jgi:hypothetical protein